MDGVQWCIVYALIGCLCMGIVSGGQRKAEDADKIIKSGWVFLLFWPFLVALVLGVLLVRGPKSGLAWLGFDVGKESNEQT